MPNPNQQTFNPRVYGEAIKSRIVDTDKLGDKANPYDLELRENIAEHGKTPAALKIASHAIAESIRLEEESGEREESPERHRFEAVAGLGNYIDNSIRLEMLNKTKARRGEKTPYLLEQAEFSHTLQNMLDSDPDTNIKDIERFLLNMYTLTERPATKPEIWNSKLTYAKDCIEIALEGARSELALKKILESMNIGYSSDVTPEEDIQGIDGYVDFRGSKLAIDVKSTPKAVMSARSASRPTDISSIVWSCTYPEDFINNGCRISDEDMTAKHGLMYQQLNQIYTARHVQAA